MSKINKVTKKTRAKTVKNYHGTEQYNYNAKEALATIILSSFVDNKYYSTVKEGINEIREAVKKLVYADPEFVLKAAAYARQEGNMRTISQIALVEALQHDGPRPFAKTYARDIMYRADDPTECLAYHLGTYGKPIPNVLKRIVRARYEDFDEYQLSKYQLRNKDFTLKDGILLTHPNLGEIGKKIIEGTATADTWEKNLSASGKDKTKTKKEAWSESIPKMGYMALLRNLRNMINEEVDNDLFDSVLEKLADKDQVKRSRQLPFRFYAAYRELELAKGVQAITQWYCHTYGEVPNWNKNQKLMASRALDALSNALDHSIYNLGLKGRNLVVVDSSGSMFSSLSSNSSLTLVEVGVLLGVCVAKISDDSDFWTFDSTVVEKRVYKNSSVMDNVTRIVKSCNGGATYFHLVMEKVNAANDEYDNIVVFSDMQCYTSRWGARDPQSSWKLYNKRFPECVMTSVDLAGYNRGNALTIKDGLRLISGWSDKVIELIASDVHGIVEAIENYVPKYNK